jgi:Predicted transcription regulator containing HTH domain
MRLVAARVPPDGEELQAVCRIERPEVDTRPGPPRLRRHESVAHGVAASAEVQSSDSASCEWTIRDRDVEILRLCQATVIRSSGPTASSSEGRQHATSGARWSYTACLSAPGGGPRRAALREIDRLVGAELDTVKEDKLDVLVTLMEASEDMHWVINSPGPMEAFKSPMGQPDLRGSRRRTH